MCGCHDFESAPLCFAGGVGLGPGRLLRDQLIPATQVGSLTSVNNSELGMDRNLFYRILGDEHSFSGLGSLGYQSSSTNV